eukprot:TRINITY_DN18331_c0_g1_i1.p1 TRINITY_DN18331_c0_g1~~TRINITY_DN18331_c0_g1_i1.p1  ORF type:complete len:394 (+),score=102.69 TRINITY_DN18331_c0_g1_i1:218-1399(+)
MRMEKFLFEVRGDKPEPPSPNPYGPFVPPANSTTSSLFIQKWLRRLLTVPIYTLLFLLSLLLVPIILPIFLLLDISTSIRRSKPVTFLPYCRVYAFFLVYLWSEMMNIYVYGLGFYLFHLIFSPLLPPNAWQTLVYTAQHYWGARSLFAPCIPIMGIRTKLSNLNLVSPGSGPYIMFIRHSSFADTIIPQYLFSSHFRMRYVVKKELLFDPGLDILGSRSPNIFLDRQAKGPAMNQEVLAIGNLVSDYSNSSNIITCIWPEGTRFTDKTRTTLINKMRERGDLEFVKKAERLKRTLVPRMGGVLALLERNEGLKEEDRADIVFMVNWGLEKVRGMGDVVGGVLVGGDVEVDMWKISWRDVPKGKKEKEEWIYENWVKMDEWVLEREKRNAFYR